MPAHDIIENAIRKVPDFPKPGVLFYDITGILVNPKAFAYCIDRMTELYTHSLLYWMSVLTWKSARALS